MPDTITPVDQFEQDIEFIRTTDKVLGDPPGTTGVLSGPINKVIQKIANSLLHLKTRLDGLNITVPNASTTVKGIAELITKAEVERPYANADTTRIVPAKRIHDLLRHANAQATDSIRGTVLKATQVLAEGLTDTEAYLTAALLAAALQHDNAKATTSKRGTVQLATESDVKDEENTGRVVTVDSLYRTIENDFSSLTFSPAYTSATDGETQNYFGPILLNTEDNAGEIIWQESLQNASFSSFTNYNFIRENTFTITAPNGFDWNNYNIRMWITLSHSPKARADSYSQSTTIHTVQISGQILTARIQDRIVAYTGNNAWLSNVTAYLEVTP